MVVVVGKYGKTSIGSACHLVPQDVVHLVTDHQITKLNGGFKIFHQYNSSSQSGCM